MIVGADAFWQTLAVPPMVAVGKELTVTVAEPDAVAEQSVVLASFTETNAYTEVPAVPVGTLTVAVLPDEVTVCCAPPLMV